MTTSASSTRKTGTLAVLPHATAAGDTHAPSDGAARRHGEADREDQVRWLDDVEMQAWLRVLRVVMLLPGSLDRQLRRDAGLTHPSYMIMATLSDAPEQSMRMTELARRTDTSPSRLSHAVSALEQRRWVARRPCAQDARGLIASLTPEGRQVLESIAPGHVARVRASVLDPLSTGEAEQLSRLLDKIVTSLEHEDGRGDRASTASRG